MRHPGATAQEYFRMARNLVAAGDDLRGIKLYLEALQHEPDFPEALVNLGVLYNVLGDSQEALRCLGRATELAPQSSRASYNFGVALSAAGRVEEAISAFSRTLTGSPQHRNALYGLAVCWAKMSDRDRSNQFYERYRQTLSRATIRDETVAPERNRPVLRLRFVR